MVLIIVISYCLLYMPAIVCQGRSYGGLQVAVGSRNGLYGSSRECTPRPRVMCGSRVSTVRSLMWELVCIRVLSLAHCSSFWCWRLCCVSSTGAPWELLYTDDLVFIADTQEDYISKLKALKAGMESIGICGIVKKTKFLVSGDDQDVLQKSGKYPYTVCCSGVGRNSILCSQCMLWVHKTYSGITKRLVEDPNYICPRCKCESWLIDGHTVTEMDADGTMLDLEATFCYICDTLCSGGGCDSAVASRNSCLS